MKCLNLGEVSLWLTQNASMENHEETSELRDSEDDDDRKNGDKLNLKVTIQLRGHLH